MDFQQIDVNKIDVEGAELGMLQGEARIIGFSGVAGAERDPPNLEQPLSAFLNQVFVNLSKPSSSRKLVDFTLLTHSAPLQRWPFPWPIGQNIFFSVKNFVATPHGGSVL